MLFCSIQVSNEQRANLWKDSVKETKRALCAARNAAGLHTTFRADEVQASDL